MTKQIMTAVVLALTLSACSKKGTDNNKSGDPSAKNPVQTSSLNTNTESLSYQFEFNGCDTGKQVFKSKDELCMGLQNNTLNNSCAVEMRADYFQLNCPDQTFQSFDENTAVSENSHTLQITALNFITGGYEPCDVKNKIFHFSTDDKSLEVTICENSRVKVYAISGAGVVTFHAIDISSHVELPASSYSVNQSFELGKTKGMLRYGVENPYGYTYVMAEEVTGIDPELLKQWNQLTGQAAELRAQVLTAQQKGAKVPAKTTNELAKIEIQLELLSKKMQGTN